MMPMIGGEAAELAALSRRHVAEEGPAEQGARDPYGLGWVVDWLYGDAVLPPAPLPHGVEAGFFPARARKVPAYAPGEAGGRVRRRRGRQLALL